ncbi:SusC/RagA family TonB-linked outer membrane protein [Paradesertivirga mongoliensis]|uniref:SusC/RagA family TonB-linked outer membrane protein n=1 Tax=Paradesertivirga mongoliensis TaxID=2100740 RepID=A0ABW4ZLA0_9SPHI|nr:TonB-dependent receptor [Pedobacter mongoliensis]
MVISLLHRKWGLLFIVFAFCWGSAFSLDKNTGKIASFSESSGGIHSSISNRLAREKPKKKPAVQGLVKEVTGTVSDTLGPMPGVTVFLKSNPSIGTSTDLNGKYILEVPDEEAVLVFKMIGYTTVEMPVKGKRVIDVVIKTSSQMLDEAVVVAFGTQKKESVIGSITTIKPSELKVPSSNLTTALAGRVAGVIAYQRSGEPGQDNAEFFIRGATTFGYKKEPLILIDNMEYTTTELARLTPDDIESFSIMKDATANALYGARGANGVILITTKQGKEGKPKISVRMENSISSPTRNIELADPVTYMKLHTQAVLTRDPSGQGIIYSQSKIDNTESGVNPIAFPVVDWQKELFKKQTINQRANMSLSGGGQVATYYVAGSFAQDNGILKVDKRNNFNSNIDLKTFSLRSNVSINVAKGTTLGVRLNGLFDDYNGPIDGGSGIYNKVMHAPQTLFRPYYEPTDQFKSANHILFGNSDLGGFLNPYADMVKGYKEYSRSLMLAQLEVKQDLAFVTPGLTFNGMFNTNRRAYFDVTRQYNPFLYKVSTYDKAENTFALAPINPDTGTDFLNFSPGTETVSSEFYMQTAANYSRTFKDKHTVSGMTVFTMQSKLAGNAGSLQESLAGRNMGVSGRATYNYDSRYFVEFNFGYNGSERFHSSKRFGFFPSAGAAWAVSNEKFFEPFRGVVSKLRLRGNYGLVGNDAIGSAEERFFYLSEVNMNNSSYGANFGTAGSNINGISLNRYENPEVTWETAANSTFGLELGIKDNFEIIAEYFTERRYNILMDRASIPKTMGLQGSTPKANVGGAKSRAVDLTLSYNNRFGKDWVLSVRGNMTYAKNMYTQYEEPIYDNYWQYRAGQSTAQQWGYIAERLFVDDEEVRSSPTQNFNGFIAMGGDIKYRDVDGDGQITTKDQVPIGFPTRPEIVYGSGFSASYKNLDFSAFFQGSARSSFWIDVNATSPFVNNTQLIAAYAENHWSEENRDLYALWPRLTAYQNGNNDERSTWFMRNGAFLRLKQIELGYKLPVKMTKKVKINNLRLYGTATNLFTISQFDLWDIEMGGQGLGYPIQRVINFGVQVGL